MATRTKVAGALVLGLFAIAFLLLVFMGFYWTLTQHPTSPRSTAREDELSGKNARKKRPPEEVAAERAQRAEQARAAHLATLRPASLPWARTELEPVRASRHGGLATAEIPWDNDPAGPARVLLPVGRTPWSADVRGPVPTAFAAEIPWSDAPPAPARVAAAATPWETPAVSRVSTAAAGTPWDQPTPRPMHLLAADTPWSPPARVGPVAVRPAVVPWHDADEPTGTATAKKSKHATR